MAFLITAVLLILFLRANWSKEFISSSERFSVIVFFTPIMVPLAIEYWRKHKISTEVTLTLHKRIAMFGTKRCHVRLELFACEFIPTQSKAQRPLWSGQST